MTSLPLFERVFHAVNPKTNGGRMMFSCPLPAHGKGQGDRNPSCELWRDSDGGPAVKCYGGCDDKELWAAIVKPHINTEHPRRATEPVIIATYHHPTKPEKVVKRAECGEGCTFRNRDGDICDGKQKKHIYQTPGSPRGYLVLLWPPDGPDPVVWCEGEKAAKAVQDSGFTAASSIGGAGQVHNTDYSPLKGRRVLIWPDNDAAGHRAASTVAEALHKVGANAEIMSAIGKNGSSADAADLIDDERTAHLTSESARLDSPDSPTGDGGGTPLHRPYQGIRVDIGGGAVRAVQPDDGDDIPPKYMEAGAAGYAKAVSDLGIEIRLDKRSLAYHVRSMNGVMATLVPNAEASEQYPNGWWLLSDGVSARLKSLVRKRYIMGNGQKPSESEDNFGLYLRFISAEHIGDHLEEWMASLPEWDRKPRLDTMLIDCLGARDTPLNRLAARIGLMRHVARTRKPGEKADITPILGSHGQGNGKSTFVKNLLPRQLQETHFADGVDLSDSKQKRLESIGSAAAVEFADLAGMDKADVRELKSWLSSSWDKYRPPYGRTTIQHKRAWAAWGTANINRADPRYLPPDPSGNRRFIGVLVDPPGPEEVVEWLEATRAQLWAEAIYRIDNGERGWYESAPEKRLIAHHVRSLTASPVAIEIALDAFIEKHRTAGWGPDLGVHMRTIFEWGWPSHEPRQEEFNQMGNALQLRGWTNRRARESHDLRGKAMRWYPPLQPEMDIEDEPERMPAPTPATPTASAPKGSSGKEIDF